MTCLIWLMILSRRLKTDLSPSGRAGGSALSHTVSLSLFTMKSENSSFAEIPGVRKVIVYRYMNTFKLNIFKTIILKFKYRNVVVRWWLVLKSWDCWSMNNLSSLLHLCRLGGKGDLLLKYCFVLPWIHPSFSVYLFPLPPSLIPVLPTLTIQKKDVYVV